MPKNQRDWRAPNRRNRQESKISQPSPKVALSRIIAWEVLQDVDLKDAYANLALPAKLEKSPLGPRDAALTVELTYGTLRLRNYYDWVIEIASGKSVDKIATEALNALRLGAHQLLNMRVSDYAAVNEMVNLMHRKSHLGNANFVNAILRQIQRLGEQYFLAEMEKISDLDTRLALQYSHPTWIVKAYRRSLRINQEMGGQIPADDQSLEEILAANNQAPYVNLVARPSVLDREKLATEVETSGENVAYTDLSPWGLIISGGDPGRLKSIGNHRAGVEDQGSQLMAGLAAALEVCGRDRFWLDLCAGPGGKSALLAGLAHQREAQLYTNEISTHRARLVQESCQAFPEVRHFCADGTKLLLPAEVKDGFDRILVDAPCTGLGSLRRHPEARYRRSTQNIPDLTSIQRNLVSNALELLRPGGILMYVTCSPHISETIALLQQILDRHRDYKLVSLNQGIQSLIDTAAWPEGLGNAEYYLQLWPHIHGADAMFGAAIQKR